MSDSITIKEYIDQNGTMTYSNVGTSMLPLLRQGKDLFIVERKRAERCKVGDVVLFLRGDDYVLHRVIKVHENCYDILGDNSINPETGVEEDDILAVMKGFVRNGKERSVDDVGYRLYSFIITHTIHLRVFLKRVRLKVISYIKKVLV